MSTLVCQVQSRWPVALVSLYGTLDMTSAARMMVALRDVLAGAPSALVIDAEHLVVADDAALGPLVTLASDAQRWPAAGVSLCCATDATAAVIAQADGGGGLVMYGDTDAATIAARRLPVAPQRTITLSPASSAPAESRQFAQDVCTEWRIGKVTSLAELVASELVTNAVMHARTEIGVSLRLSGDTLSVAVRDGDPRPMLRPSPGAAGAPGEEHGRGFLLLDAMADAWGTSPTADGKVVWANIGLRQQGSRNGAKSGETSG